MLFLPELNVVRGAEWSALAALAALAARSALVALVARTAENALRARRGAGVYPAIAGGPASLGFAPRLRSGQARDRQGRPFGSAQDKQPSDSTGFLLDCADQRC